MKCKAKGSIRAGGVQYPAMGGGEPMEAKYQSGDILECVAEYWAALDADRRVEISVGDQCVVKKECDQVETAYWVLTIGGDEVWIHSPERFFKKI